MVAPLGFWAAAKGAAGAVAGTAAANYATDKVLNVPSPGEAAAQFNRQAYPGLNPWELTGAGGAQVGSSEVQARATRRASAQAAGASLGSSAMSSRATVVSAALSSGLSDSDTLDRLTDLVVDGKPMTKSSAGALVTPGTSAVAQNADTNARAQTTREFLANVEHDKTLAAMVVEADGGNGYGRVVQYLMESIGISKRQVASMPKFKSMITMANSQQFNAGDLGKENFWIKLGVGALLGSRGASSLAGAWRMVSKARLSGHAAAAGRRGERAAKTAIRSLRRGHSRYGRKLAGD